MIAIAITEEVAELGEAQFAFEVSWADTFVLLEKLGEKELPVTPIEFPLISQL